MGLDKVKTQAVADLPVGQNHPREADEFETAPQLRMTFSCRKRALASR
jgi:hypothetical protein